MTAEGTASVVRGRGGGGVCVRASLRNSDAHMPDYRMSKLR